MIRGAITLATRMVGAARVFGYLLRVTREGWESFCAKVRTPVDAIEALLPGSEIHRKAKNLDGTDGFTTEDVAAFFVRLAG